MAFEKIRLYNVETQVFTWHAEKTFDFIIDTVSGKVT